jgi:hypothetical protein
MVVAWELLRVGYRGCIPELRKHIDEYLGMPQILRDQQGGKGNQKGCGFGASLGWYRGRISHLGKDVSKEVRTPLIMRPVMG